MPPTVLATDTAVLSALLQRWGDMPVEKERVREVSDFVDQQGLTQVAAWLSDKAVEGEAFTLREFALFSLLFNESALLTHYAQGTAVSFDITPALTHALSLVGPCTATQEEEHVELEAFERELDELVLESSMTPTLNAPAPTPTISPSANSPPAEPTEPPPANSSSTETTEPPPANSPPAEPTEPPCIHDPLTTPPADTDAHR